jgi:hypothetical protein
MGSTPNIAAAVNDCPAPTADPIGRTIKLAATTKNCDTASFLAETLAGPAFDPTTQYTITLNADGSIKVADNTSVAAAVAFPPGDGVNNTLWNIENLRFCAGNDPVTNACNAFVDLPVAPTAFAASPLAFGNVKVGAVSTVSLTVSNAGIRPLVLNGLASFLTGSNAAFSIVPTGTAPPQRCHGVPPAPSGFGSHQRPLERSPGQSVSTATERR